MSEPPGGAEERRQFVEEELERRACSRRLLDEIEQRRQEAERQDFNITAPTAEQLVKKLASAESPTIYSQMWSPRTASGGTLNYIVSFYKSRPHPVVQPV